MVHADAQNPDATRQQSEPGLVPGAPSCDAAGVTRTPSENEPDSSAGKLPSDTGPKSGDPEMGPEFRILVEGKPVAQPRPRVFRGGGVATDNARSRCWKLLVREEFRKTLRSGPVFPTQAVNLTVIFNFLRPKSGKGKNRPWPYVKPDVDNLLKAVKDAGAGWLWTDDAQVCRCLAEKRYSNWTGAEIRVSAL